MRPYLVPFTLTAACICVLVRGVHAEKDVTVDVDLSRVAMRTDPKYLSIALGSRYFIEDKKWAGWSGHFDDERFRAVTAALAPAYMRIGGTSCDVVRYDVAAEGCGAPAAAHRGTDPTPRVPFTLTRCRYDAILKWANSTGLPVLWDLNVLSDRPGGKWDPANAMELIRYTTARWPGVVAGWELGNEPEGWVRNFGIDVSNAQLADDFRALRRAVGPDVFLVGPDYGIQGCASKGLPCKEFKELVGLLADGGGTVNISTFHFYNLGRDDTPDGFLDPRVLDLSRSSVEVAVAANAAAATPLPVWLGEGATASGGGIAGASGTYTATLMWLDRLGATGRFGGSGVMRQALFGGQYALLDPDTYDPRPTYWVAVLFKQLMGGGVDNVLAVAGDTEALRTARVYARCGGGAGGRVVVFGTNVGTGHARLTFTSTLAAAASRTDYVLTGELGGRTIALNGRPMVLDGARVPRFAGKAAAAASDALVVPPRGSFFAEFTGVAGAAAVCGM